MTALKSELSVNGDEQSVFITNALDDWKVLWIEIQRRLAELLTAATIPAFTAAKRASVTVG